jgi:dihydrofolate reductase
MHGMANLPLTIVVAVARNGVIGDKNRLIWRLKSDLQRFKALTLGKPVIMGSKTYLSIGKPLPGRANIILTRDRAFAAAGVHVVHDRAEALAVAQQQAADLGADEIIIGGGAELYRMFLNDASVAHVTEVDAAPEGDTYFPWPLGPEWQERLRETHTAGPNDEFGFSFIEFLRQRDKTP